jgi:hypothetical protein
MGERQQKQPHCLSSQVLELCAFCEREDCREAICFSACASSLGSRCLTRMSTWVRRTTRAWAEGGGPPG